MLDLNVTDAMFSLLRTVLRGDCKLSDRDVEVIQANLRQMYDMSKRNDMAHLVGYALEKQSLISPEDEVFAAFQKQQYLAIYRYEGMEYEIVRMRDALENEKIDFVLLKGATMRELYPEGWMRTSSDIDILIRQDDLARAEKCLIDNLEYKQGPQTEHDHSLHSPGGVHVELHFSLIEDGRAALSSSILSNVWDYAAPISDGKNEHVLFDEMFYFYHVAHLAKHVERAGSGLRPFLDLWLINSNWQEKNLEGRKKLLRQAGLEKFATVCEELSEYWFGNRREISQTTEKLELFVLNCGTYGTMENSIIITHNEYGGTRKYIFKRIFLPYKQLAMAYPIIKKHKWLTPFVAVARWCKLLKWRMVRKAVSEVKISKSASREKVENMQNFMSEMGL